MDPAVVPHLINALLALGMAIAFIAADRRSPTSRALGLFLGTVGLAIAVGALVARPMHARIGVPAWDGVFAIPETLAFVFAYEWLLRVRRTVPARIARSSFFSASSVAIAFFSVTSSSPVGSPTSCDT